MKTKHSMGRINGGWNYRGYCVYLKVKGQAGLLWQMADEGGDEWAFFFATLEEFRETVDHWHKQRAREQATRRQHERVD